MRRIRTQRFLQHVLAGPPFPLAPTPLSKLVGASFWNVTAHHPGTPSGTWVRQVDWVARAPRSRGPALPCKAQATQGPVGATRGDSRCKQDLRNALIVSDRGLSGIDQGYWLQRLRSWAGQAPTEARGRIIEFDRTIHALLCHPFNNRDAEPIPLRRRHERPLALGPADGEGVSVGAPADAQGFRHPCDGGDDTGPRWGRRAARLAR
jgi:hypothetical protein